MISDGTGISPCMSCQYSKQNHKMSKDDTIANPEFGPVHIINPQSRHTGTAIVLHGRGSNGQEFADEFFSSHLSGHKPLASALPGWRWVFPSSPSLWSTTFQESIPAWFEARSLTDTTARQDLQTNGIAASVRHIQVLIDEEIARLDGNASHVLLGGISQGAAVGIWTLLCPGPARGIGAFFGSSTWLPFAANIERAVLQATADASTEPTPGEDESDAFVRGMMTLGGQPQGEASAMKILLGHGDDDAYVDITLGRQARNVLSKAGFIVEWKEYSGAEEEGHWFKVPDQMDDIYQFIKENYPDEGE